MRKLALATASVAFLLTATAAHAADPAAICQSGKLKASGKYASCVLSADAKAVKTGDPADYTKCDEKIGRSFSKAEDKGQGHCPGGMGDQGAIQTFLDTCEQSVKSALANGLPPPPVNLEVRSFTDNDDGTITDDVTGLMWEKFSDDGSIHDWRDRYTWNEAFGKVSALNSTNFAGHSDWRVPRRLELETLLDFGTYNPATYAAFNTGCTPGCTVLTCSCTVSSNYWSATTLAYFPSTAWSVDFYDGYVLSIGKNDPLYVRAVRGGS